MDKKITATFGIPNFLFSFLGASIVGILSQDVLKVILGIFLVVGTGGALRATFLTGFNLEKTKYIATAAVRIHCTRFNKGINHTVLTLHLVTLSYVIYSPIKRIGEDK